MTKSLTAIIALGLCLVANDCIAQASARSNARMVQLQERVDELYERGKYERAYLIYRDELAMAGDKYAQYMVGYMNLQGKGVKPDPIAASAWYRLAAERGTEEFVMVRDKLLSKFDDVDVRQSDARYLELRKKYSDVALLLRLIKRNYEQLGDSTGSRLGASGSAMTVVDTRTGRPMSGDEYYGQIRKQLEARLKKLGELMGVEDFEVDPDKVHVNTLETQVSEFLEQLP